MLAALISRRQNFILLICCLQFFYEKMAENLARFSRYFSTQKVLMSSLSQPLKPEALNAHGGDWKMWRTLFFVVCCPAIAVCTLNAMIKEEPPRPEFKKYAHLRIRNKTFPWRDGVKTLFHNPHVNALPDGYES